MVVCIIPCRLYGPQAGDYLRGQEYQDDSLATTNPAFFVQVPVEEPAPEKEPDPETNPTKRRK